MDVTMTDESDIGAGNGHVNGNGNGHTNGNGNGHTNGNSGNRNSISDGSCPLRIANIINNSDTEEDEKVDEAAVAALFEPGGTYEDINRDDVTRTLIQTLQEVGYPGLAKELSRQSNTQLESPMVQRLRDYILNGRWTEVKYMIENAKQEPNPIYGTQNASSHMDSAYLLKVDTNRNELIFKVVRQQFLELVFSGADMAALSLMRNKLVPLAEKAGITSRYKLIEQLSALIISSDRNQIAIEGGIPYSTMGSRQKLWESVSDHISVSSMMSKGRLSDMVRRLALYDLNECKWHTSSLVPSLTRHHKCDYGLFPRYVGHRLQPFGAVAQEIWNFKWSNSGKYLAICGANGDLAIVDVSTFQVVCEHKGLHSGGLSTVAWSPDDQSLVTCSVTHEAKVIDPMKFEVRNSIKNYGAEVTGCVWESSGTHFLVSSLDQDCPLARFERDGTLVKTYDLKYRISDMAAIPGTKRLALARYGMSLCIYDYEVERQISVFHRALNCMTISVDPEGLMLFVGTKDRNVVALDMETGQLVHAFSGKRYNSTVLRVNVGGADSMFVVSGSEDGYVYVWHNGNGKLVAKLEGHAPKKSVSAGAFSPVSPHMIASCGDDGKVILWVNEPEYKRLKSRHVEGRHFQERALHNEYFDNVS